MSTDIELYGNNKIKESIYEDGTFITIDGNSFDQVKVNENDKKSYDSIVGIVDIHSL